MVNSKVRIRPSIEAQRHYGGYSKHGYQAKVEIEKSDLEEIWEIRSPIHGFKFDAEPILYLKKKGI